MVKDGTVSSKTSEPPLPAGLPGWKRASCLGCDGRIVQARTGYVTLAGTRTGSYLISWGAEPLLARTTDVDGPPRDPGFILGVAHHHCFETARRRLQAGLITLPTHLPRLDVDQGPEVPVTPYTLHLPADSNRCPFCDTSTDLSREHVWPDWYSRKLRADGKSPVGAEVRRGRIDMTVPVCRSCNNTWMSVLENDVRPTLTRLMDVGAGDGSSFVLTPTHQANLATWAVKTAYILDAWKEPVVPRGFLQEFALKRVPDESIAVWIGAYTPDVAARSVRRPLTFEVNRAAGPHRPRRPGSSVQEGSPNGFVVTFTLLSVLFQVLGQFNGGRMNLRDQRRQYDSALFRIWPAHTSDLLWPPRFGFSSVSWHDLIESIVDRNGDLATGGLDQVD